MVINLNQAHISPHRWQETIHMVRQELQPVCPTSKFGLHCIIFEDIEIRTTLNKKMDQFWYFILKTKTHSFPRSSRKGIHHKVEMELKCRNTHSRKIKHCARQCILKLKIIFSIQSFIIKRERSKQCFQEINILFKKLRQISQSHSQ